MQNYQRYCLIGNSDFVITNSLYSSAGKSPSSFFNFWPIKRPKKLNFRGSKHFPNYKFLGAMLTAGRCVGDVVLPQEKETDHQSFPYFDPCSLINNNINRFHKSTYEELLEKIDNSVSVHEKELKISYYGTIVKF